MLVFVDESGDPGLKGKTGSSQYFVLTAVIFEDVMEAEKCGMEIDKLREQLGLGRQEFKFNKCSRQTRVAFLRGMERFSFVYLSFVLNKEKLRGHTVKRKESLYKYPIQTLFQNAQRYGYFRDATVVIDGTGDRVFRRQLQSYLRQRIVRKDSTAAIKAMRMSNSKNHSLLQLADMICGAVARSYNEAKDDRDVYRALNLSKEIYVQKWP